MPTHPNKKSERFPNIKLWGGSDFCCSANRRFISPLIANYKMKNDSALRPNDEYKKCRYSFFRISFVIQNYTFIIFHCLCT